MAKYTARQWLILGLLSVGNISQACVASILAPFYPSEAEAKGVSSSIYGFVFGIYMLTMFIVSPIYGKYTNQIGVRNLFNIGLYVSGLCCISFSFLAYINNTILFICCSFALRILSACGNASFTCATFVLSAKEFPDNVSAVFGLLGTTWGLGAIIGPFIGGVLYELGGFLLPFLCNGSLVLLIGIISTFLIPKYNEGQNEKDNIEKDNIEKDNNEVLTMSRLFKLPETYAFISPMFAGAFSVGYFQTALEVHLRQFNLSPLQIGGMFMIEGISYSTTCPLWGLLSDKVLRPIVAIQIGTILMFTSFFIIGPAPFLPIEPSIPLIICGICCFGVGFGGAFVVGFGGLLQGAHNNGFAKNLATDGVVSGVFSSTFSLGCFAGPSVGGYLLDHFGFRLGSLMPLVLQLVVIFIACIYMCFRYKRRDI